MGCLAKSMFCIRADVEGAQFSREGERDYRNSANAVLRISIQLPHRKRHINNILYKLLQQHMLICSTVKFLSKAHNHNLR